MLRLTATARLVGHNDPVAEYEYRAISVPPMTTREELRQLLSINAEYGGWELARHQIWTNGRRKVTVRRRLSREPLPSFIY